jgi:multiple sugar transport system permease protein
MARSRSQQARQRKLLVHAALIAILFFLSIPFFWLLSTSFKPQQEILARVPRWIPSTFTLEHYRKILVETDVPLYFRNSLFVAAGTSILCVLLTSLAAYALSRFTFRGKALYTFFILASQMFPSVLFLAPMFIVLKRYGLINSHWGLIIAYSTFVLPFTTWLLKGYFDTLPVDLEEAALTEGATRGQALLYIVIPLAAPGMATTVLFAFLFAWQEFLFAFTYIQSNDLRTLPPGVGLTFAFDLGANFGNMMVMSAIMTVPVVMLFIFLQRYIVQGLTAGAVKG